MSQKTLPLPLASLFIIQQLQAAGYEAYLVGGSVRDLLMGKTPLDFDFTTNATPTQIMAVFPNSFYENEFGTVSVTPAELAAQLQLAGYQLPAAPPVTTDSTATVTRLEVIKIDQSVKLHQSLSLPSATVNQADSLHNFEITTYRQDETYQGDNRHPDHLVWGKDLSTDLARRDFTINALALTIPAAPLANLLADKNLPPTIAVADYQLIDQFGGQADIAAGLIRAIGEPQTRFHEDALRLLRAIRFSVQLNFSVEVQTFAAIQTAATLITTISGERVRDELLKIIASDQPKEGIILLEETGLLANILPELRAGQGVTQGGHHLTDVWTHALDALACCPSPDPIVRLATLLHDVGKPETRAENNGKITFYNHQVVGAFTAKKIAQRLRLNRDDTNRIFTLIYHHMFHYQPENTDASIRRFMRRVGMANLNDILALREADRLGSNARQTSWRLEEMKLRMIEQLHQPMEVRDLAINGHDLMKELNLTPGPILGQLLQQLLELVLDDSSLNNREQLLTKAHELFQAPNL